MLSPAVFSQSLGGTIVHSLEHVSIANAQSPSSGSCFPNGPQTINSAITWENLQCTHSGNLLFENSASLMMINSTLTQVGNRSISPNVAATGSVLLTGASSLSLLGSTVKFLNGSSSLQLLDNSNLTISKSEIISANVSESNNATIAIRENSLIDIYGLQMRNLTNLFLDTSALTCVQNCSSIKALANRISLSQSTFTSQNTGPIYLSGQSTYVSNSQIRVFNSTGMILGGFANNSITAITGSVVNETGPITENLTLIGFNSLQVANSTIANQVTTLANANATLNFVGGNVSLIRSSIISSARGFYGYSTFTSSTFSTDSSSNLEVNQSQISAGQVAGQYGVYSFSKISLASQGNIDIIGSYLQSEASESANFTIQTKTPATTLHYVSMNDTTFETNNSPGSVTILSNYELFLDQSKIDANDSEFNIGTYVFTAYNSNITASLSFGKSIGVGNLYNTTTRSISGNSFSNYGWFSAQVVPGGQACMPGCVSNANITLFDPVTGQADYFATTNSSGFARIPIMLSQSTSQGERNWPYYIVEVDKGDLRSRQIAVNTSLSSLFSLPLGTNSSSNGLFGQCISNSVEPVISCASNSTNYINFGIQYGYLKPTTYLGILSNAFPVALYNNATVSEFDFRTLGSSGYNFNISVLYATNFTSVTPTIQVDGKSVQSTVSQYNSTYTEDVFSIPSGPHSITFSYDSPSGFFVYQVYPQFYPASTTILVVILLAVVASVFLIYYVRNSDRSLRTRSE
ncbi:MAG: hypothetical protein ACYC7D_03195 [Nitrososphaerales archaeon]